MRMLLSKACNPPLSLSASLKQWRDIAQKLREPPRKRTYQSESEIVRLLS